VSDSTATAPQATAAPASPEPAPAGAWHLFRALRSRNYRLFFAGHGTSLIGTWMQRVAQQWLVWRLTESALMLGVVGFVGQIPSLLLSPLAGVIADRWNLRRLLIITQCFAMLQSVILAVLTLTDTVQVWHVIALSIMLGVAHAFDMPIRQSLVVHMVQRPSDLSNAIALNSSLVNAARLVGPAVAGALIVKFGEGVCFLLNAASYIAVLAALGAMRLDTAPLRRGAASVLGHLREGFSYAFGFRPIRAVLVLLATSSLLGMSYATLLPVFADQRLGGGPRTLGFLFAAAGVGALCGALYLAARPSVLGLGRVLVRGALLFGLGLIAFATSEVLWLSLGLMLLVGLGMMLQMACANTILQSLVDDDKRGRVMSLYTMSLLGVTPFGSLLLGWLAHELSPPAALQIAGAVVVVGAVVFAVQRKSLWPLVRPVYERKGIIAPEVGAAAPPPGHG
jgi:MFS family permease